MLEDEQIEEISITAAKAYMQCTSMEEFIEIMEEFHYNVPKYVFRIMYYSISEFDQG